MTEGQQLHKETEITLDSLQGIKRASPAPFFYTRVQARMQRGKADVFEKISAYITRPSFLTAGLCLILLINVLTISLEKEQPATAADEPDRVYSGEEYTLAVNSFYTIESEQPY